MAVIVPNGYFSFKESVYKTSPTKSPHQNVTTVYNSFLWFQPTYVEKKNMLVKSNYMGN